MLKQLELEDSQFSMVNLTVEEGFSLVLACDTTPEVIPELQLPPAAVGNGRTLDVPLRQRCSVWVVPVHSTDLSARVEAVYFGTPP